MRSFFLTLSLSMMFLDAATAFDEAKPAENSEAAASESAPPATADEPAKTDETTTADAPVKTEEAAKTAEPASEDKPVGGDPVEGTASKTPAPATLLDQASYQIGIQIGKDLKKNSMLMVNPNQIAAGIATILADKESVLSDEEVRAAIAELQKEIRRLVGSAGARNKAAGLRFLEENKSKPNVTVTASGLQYQVLQEGTGAVPTATSKVSTHYRGRLINGKVFDESYEGPEPTPQDSPASFPVSGVIPGWTEALKMMKVGARYRLYIPSELAYGENGAGEDIGANEVLIFDVELVSIEAE